MTLTRLGALAAVLFVIAGAALGIHRLTGSGSSIPANAPAAAAMYWRSLSALAATPRFQISESYHQTLPAAMTQMHLSGESDLTMYRIRHTTAGGIEALKTEQSPNPVFVPPFRLVLHDRTLCLGVSSGQGSSTSQVQMSWIPAIHCIEFRHASRRG